MAECCCQQWSYLIVGNNNKENNMRGCLNLEKKVKYPLSRGGKLFSIIKQILHPSWGNISLGSRSVIDKENFSIRLLEIFLSIPIFSDTIFQLDFCKKKFFNFFSSYFEVKMLHF